MRRVFYFLAIALTSMLFFSSCDKDNTVKDIDGNQYTVVRIGYQEWMVENLKVTHYNDGTPITYAATDVQWAFADSVGKGAWCVYDFYGDADEALTANSYVTYGPLYNFYAIQSGKLAPEGWRVATEEDWNVLQLFISYNGWNYDETHTDNKVAKALVDNKLWRDNEPGDDPGDIGSKDAYVKMYNISGFSALPAGDRHPDGKYFFQGEQTFWWTSTYLPNITTAIWSKGLSYTESAIISDPAKAGYGFSVRCVRDVE
ncbi:MAG: fibrobacter succinogenes major paralogous domain-containing protein [Paludibacteraceae bacterium]|nr:fibrobacter succinogenes major paralogous domain-containing protein [Paludibacteraceae bacterium]